jgi:hypothetical membrane protein
MSQSRLAKSVSGDPGLNIVLALAGIVGPIMLVVADMIVAFSDPGYNLIRHSISSLAWARLGWVQTIGFLAIGLLVELFVAGLYLNIRGVRGFGFGIGLLAVFGFGLLLIGAFHTDPAVGPSTVEGTIHGAAAKTIFWLFPIATLLISPSLRRDRRWRRLFIYSIAAAAFAVVFMILSVRLPPDLKWFGLLERILVADEIIWVEVMAISLLFLRLKHGSRLNRFAGTSSAEP